VTTATTKAREQKQENKSKRTKAREQKQENKSKTKSQINGSIQTVNATTFQKPPSKNHPCPKPPAPNHQPPTEGGAGVKASGLLRGRGNFNNRKTAYLNNRWDLGDARSTQQHGTLSPRMRRIAGSLWVKF
jgi:hypothetical protein